MVKVVDQFGTSSDSNFYQTPMMDSGNTMTAEPLQSPVPSPSSSSSSSYSDDTPPMKSVTIITPTLLETLKDVDESLDIISTTTKHNSLNPSTQSPLDVSDLSSSLRHFGWIDYLVFVMMLIVCAVIGVYFGFIEKRKKKKGRSKSQQKRRGSEALDYLVGGRQMKVIPVSLSLVAR